MPVSQAGQTGVRRVDGTGDDMKIPLNVQQG
jgi:hypothetical protein